MKEGQYPAAVVEAAGYIRRESGLPLVVGVVLGSGIGRAWENWDIERRHPYDTIPNFPSTGVVGHAGELLMGRIGGMPAVVMSGRSHYYETGSTDALTFSIRTLCASGISALILTNSAGAVSTRVEPGMIMLVQDHICFPALAGFSPLVGPNTGPGPRFPVISGVYDSQLLSMAVEASQGLETRVTTGTYAMVGGPYYETAAEVSFLERIGADAVGMSTAAEAIVAKHCGIKVLGISVITNSAGIHSKEDGHKSVLGMAKRMTHDVSTIVEAVASRIIPD